VAELRRALGDSAHQPQIIETIPKRGYRIIAPIASVVVASSPEPSRQSWSALLALTIGILVAFVVALFIIGHVA
jgi:DNA-binding winged helix-turn-helix (wHTH) protein